MRKETLKRFGRGVLACTIVLAATSAEAADTTTGARTRTPDESRVGVSPAAVETESEWTGILDQVNHDGAWLVIDDRAVWYGADLKVHLPTGVAAVGDGALKSGTPVRVTIEEFDGRPYARAIWVLKSLPAENDDD